MKKKIIKVLVVIILLCIIVVLSGVIFYEKNGYIFIKKNVSNENNVNQNNVAATKEVLNVSFQNLAVGVETKFNDAAVYVKENPKPKEEIVEEKKEEVIPDKSETVSSAPANNGVISLNDRANAIANSYGNTTRTVYGTSYQGRPLEGYVIKGNGSNSKTIFMEFEVHGFEDEYAKDGKVLVNLGNTIVEYYAANPDLLGDYQMVVVPSANPDGVIEGVNNTRVGNGYAFGRATAAGIDMNRDFKAGAFSAQETQALKSFMSQFSMDIHLDFHGWENSVIGDQTIVNTFLAECGLAYNKGGRWGSGQGYVIEYTKNAFGSHSAIVEFRNSSSVNASNVENALNKIMQLI